MPIRVAIAYTAEGFCRNKFFAERLIELFKQRGAFAELVIVDGISAAEINADICVMRAIDYDLSAKLSVRGVKVFNDPFISLVCNDKHRTLKFVSERGIRVSPSALFDGTNIFPLDTEDSLLYFGRRKTCGDAEQSAEINSIEGQTRGFESGEKKTNICEELGANCFPLVAKSRFGHGGTLVFFCRDLGELRAAYAAIGEDEIIIQKPADLGKDLRVYVLGGRVIAAVLRTSSADFRSNFSLGGQANIYPLSDKEKALALAVAALLPTGFFGVDFLFDGDALILSEIEDVVGTRMLYSLGIADAAALFVDYVLGQSEGN